MRFFPFTLPTLFLAPLTACGGGGSGDTGVGTGAVPYDGSASVHALAQAQGATVDGAPASVAASATLLAVEGQTFTLTSRQTVRYGAESSWIARELSGVVACTNDFFGVDPLPWVAKTCQLVQAEPTNGTPFVDFTQLPAPAAGSATERVGWANVADWSQRPVPSDTGSFREVCTFSHMSYADPIVNPGSLSPHLHTFFGNTGTDAHSTANSIANAGNSTCAGGTANRTAYWVPSMINTRSGTPLRPSGVMVYYKQGYNYVSSAAIRPFPAGLRMVAGNAASNGIQDGVAGYTCFKPDGSWENNKAIPSTCPAGSVLTASIVFPQCWDGVNLDSPDHKSHMAYAGLGCPNTHPVPLSAITFNVNYYVAEADATRYWRLSSDAYDRNQPAGYSAHADWFDGWKAETTLTWTTRCINASMDCHAFLIGDGRILY